MILSNMTKTLLYKFSLLSLTEWKINNLFTITGCLASLSQRNCCLQIYKQCINYVKYGQIKQNNKKYILWTNTWYYYLIWTAVKRNCVVCQGSHRHVLMWSSYTEEVCILAWLIVFICNYKNKTCYRKTLQTPHWYLFRSTLHYFFLY